MSDNERSFFITLIQVELKNNTAPAPQRLVRNEKYAAIEHQGHCGGGFLKRAEKSSAE